MKDVAHPILSKIELTEQEANLLESSFEKRNYLPKSQLVQFNKKTDELFLVIQGSIRKYCIKDGQEFTIYIATEGQFAVEFISFLSGGFSENILETIEDCEVLVIKKKRLESLYNSIPKMNEFIRKVLENVLIETQTVLNEFIMLSPEERYLKIIQNKKQLLNRIPQYILASYLGISATSLSRIRKRISLSME